MRFVLQTLAPTLCLVSLTACSALGLGQSDYSCPGMPDGIRCMSARDVYAATDDSASASPSAKPEAAIQAKARPAHNRDATTENPVSQAGPETAKRANALKPVAAPKVSMHSLKESALPPIRQITLPVPLDPTAHLRTPAQVMRIWVAPWEDVHGDLMMPGYVYTEIEARRWVVGAPAPRPASLLKPLQTFKPTRPSASHSNSHEE